MSWKCPRCNTIHPYSVTKCSCGGATSFHKKPSLPTQMEKDQTIETVDLELADEAEIVTEFRIQAENLGTQTRSRELEGNLDTLGLERQVREHFERATENDAEDVILRKPKYYGEIEVVDLNYGKKETMGASVRKRTSSAYERFVLTTTRVLALCGAVVMLVGIAVLAVLLLSSKSTTVTYEELTRGLPSSDSEQFPLAPAKVSAPSVPAAIPANLQHRFQGRNSDIFSSWLKSLSASAQRDFLINLSSIVEQADEEAISEEKFYFIVNTYHDLKMGRLRPSEIEKHTALAAKSGYIAGIFGLILCILSLVVSREIPVKGLPC